MVLLGDVLDIHRELPGDADEGVARTDLVDDGLAVRPVVRRTRRVVVALVRLAELLVDALFERAAVAEAVPALFVVRQEREEAVVLALGVAAREVAPREQVHRIEHRRLVGHDRLVLQHRRQGRVGPRERVRRDHHQVIAPPRRHALAEDVRVQPAHHRRAHPRRPREDLERRARRHRDLGRVDRPRRLDRSKPKCSRLFATIAAAAILGT